MNNRFMKSYERMDGAFSTTVVVDSLPTSPQPNVIYAVKKLDYYTSFYGLHISPLTSMSDVNTNVLADLMRQNGWKLDEITQQLFAGILVMGLLPENLTEISNFKGHFINEYTDKLFKLKTYIDEMGVDFDKSFEKLDDLYQYLFSEEYAQAAGFFIETFTNTQAKLREHNFVWSEQALPDYQLGVVFTPTYEYYIYNGEEYVNIDYKAVITKSVEVDSIEEDLNTLTFTRDEVNLLSDGADLIITCNLGDGTTQAHAKKMSIVKMNETGEVVGLSYELTFYLALFINYYGMVLHKENNGKFSTNAAKLTQTNSGYTTIPVSSWTEGSNTPYVYSANITSIKNIDTQSTVLVMFDRAAAESGNFSPYVETNDGVFTIYAKEKPTTDVSIHVEVFN